MRGGFLTGCLALLLGFMLSSLAKAETDIRNIRPGIVGNYYGLQVGTTNVYAQNMNLPNNSGTLVLVRPSRKGFGMRVSTGYRFIDYLAMEGGYTYYSPATYAIPNGNSPEIRLQALDILGKGIMPIYWGIDAFVKGGAAIVYWKEGGLLAPNPNSSHDGAHGITVRPELAIGLSYDFTPNWTVDMSATMITKGGKVPKTNFYAVGLYYRAVDLFCGQFLC